MFNVIEGGYMKTEKRPVKLTLLTENTKEEYFMVTIQFKNLDNHLVQAALNTLGNAPIRSQTAYKVSKIKKAIMEEVSNGRDLYKKLLEKHVEKNEDGTPKYDEKGMAVFLKDAQPAFEKEMEDFLKTTIELPIQKLQFAELNDIKISADQIAAIDFILES